MMIWTVFNVAGRFEADWFVAMHDDTLAFPSRFREFLAFVRGAPTRGQRDRQWGQRSGARWGTEERAMVRLYGRAPFEDAPVVYEAVKCGGYWAIAGNPVQWNRECCRQYFESHRDGDDACFGSIHEMGHNFEQTRVSDLNHEMMANLALCYAVEVLGLPILFDHERTIGRGLQDGFYRRCYERTIKVGTYHHDGLLFCILRVKDAIDWEPFEVVMRQLIEKDPGEIQATIA
jgi:hypothetical protein